MAAAAKRTSRNNDLKKILPMVESIDTAKKTERALYTWEHQGLESGIAAARNYCAMLKQFGQMIPGMGEFVVDNEKTLNTVCRVGMEMVDGAHKFAEDVSRIAREIIDCTSFDQFYTVQQMAMSQLSKRCVEEASRAQRMLCGGFGTVCMLPPD